MKLTELRVNHMEMPLGIQMYPPIVWIIILKSLLVRGQDTSGRSQYVPIMEKQPVPGVGLKQEKCRKNGRQNGLPMIIRKCLPASYQRFCLEQKTKRVRMYMCGLGVYELYINNCKVGAEYLAPGYHAYDLHLQAQSYDVTSYINEGNNEIKVWLGEGWFKGRLGFDGGYKNVYGDRLYVIAELRIEYENDQVDVITTGNDWECQKSPIVSAFYFLWFPLYQSGLRGIF